MIAGGLRPWARSDLRPGAWSALGLPLTIRLIR